MMESQTSQPDSHPLSSEPRRPTQDIRARAERLQKKVAELSKTFDHLEQTLDEAADEKKNPKG